MLLSELATELGAQYIGEADITGATHDSRAVVPGDIYIAVPGFNRHGIDFVEQAISRGAVAVASTDDALSGLTNIATLSVSDVRVSMGAIASAVHGHPERKLRIIGVTGTNGKSTVTAMVRHILRNQGRAVALMGTLGTFIGDEHIPGSRTTPEATDMYALLARMVDAGITDVVMEVSSHGLVLHRVSGLQFAAAGFTNLTQDHLDFHETMQNYFDAKALLFDMCDSAVINTDDEWGKALFAQCVARNLRAHSLGTAGDVRVTHLEQSLSTGLTFDLTGEIDVHIQLPVVGSFNASNAAMAVLLANEVGVSIAEATDALRSFTGVAGRLEQVEIPRGAAFVDYAHTPDAVSRVLETLVELGPSRVITVIGCGGDRDSSKREPMGAMASMHSDVVIVTDDNPRSEDPAVIRAAVLQGAHSGNAKVVEVADRREAIRCALSLAENGDVIAVLGKGHESGQEIAGVVHPFDDRDVLRQEARYA